MRPSALLVVGLCLVAGQADAAGLKKGYAMCRDEGSLRSLVGGIDGQRRPCLRAPDEGGLSNDPG